MNLSTRMKIFSVAASASLITLALPTTRAQSPSDPNSRYFTAAWNKNPPEDRVYKYDIYATPTEEVIEQLEALGGPTYFPGLIFAADETNPPASGMWLNQMNAGTSLMQFDPEREPTVLTANGRSTVHFNNDWMSATLPFNRDQGLTIFSVFLSLVI